MADSIFTGITLFIVAVTLIVEELRIPFKIRRWFRCKKKQ